MKNWRETVWHIFAALALAAASVPNYVNAQVIPGLWAHGPGGSSGSSATTTTDSVILDIANHDVYFTRDAAGRAMVSKDGTGAGTNAGWKYGYCSSSAVSCFWSSVLSASTTNFVLKTDSTSTTIGGSDGTANGIIYFSPTGTGSRGYFDGTAGAGLAITAGTATTGVNGLSVTQTWNNAAQLFTLLYANATDTTSSASSLLMDLQAGGVSKFKVSKGGAGTFTGNVNGATGVFNDVHDGNNSFWEVGATSLNLASSYPIAFSSTTGYGGSKDAYIKRYAPGQVSFTKDGTGAGTNAGWILGYYGISTISGLWPTDQGAPTSSNYSLIANTNNTQLNGGNLYFKIADVVKMTLLGTAGQGAYITAGTATADVAALSVTRTNNNAAVATGVQFAFTDTTSAAGFLPFQVLGGAAGTTSLFSLSKTGVVTSGGQMIAAGALASPAFANSTGVNGFYFPDANTISAVIGANTTPAAFKAAGLGLAAGKVVGWMSDGDVTGAADTNFSRISAGVVGVGTGAAGSTAGTLNATTLGAATNFKIAGCCEALGFGTGQLNVGNDGTWTKINFGNATTTGIYHGGVLTIGTTPTLASGGCTSPTAVTSNGTAAFSVGVGTGCSGSQPLVFTLPAATTGWQCNARNATNAATSVAAHSNGVSTTNVTITSYSRTTGLAQAWTDSDVVVVSCMGY